MFLYLGRVIQVSAKRMSQLQLYSWLKECKRPKTILTLSFDTVFRLDFSLSYISSVDNVSKRWLYKRWKSSTYNSKYDLAKLLTCHSSVRWHLHNHVSTSSLGNVIWTEGTNRYPYNADTNCVSNLFPPFLKPFHQFLSFYNPFWKP